MEAIEFLLTTSSSVIGTYLFFNCSYLLFFSIAGHQRIPQKIKQAKTLRKFCILIPAYKEDVVILHTAKSAVEHSYQGSSDVFVIADGLKPETIRELKNLGSGVIEVNFDKSTKGKALQTAMNVLPEDSYDVAVVLDADNIMDEGFLEEFNKAFEEGYQVVQGHRTAKNMDTPFALLDACNEEINNQIFRRGPRAMGLSSALIGSGMAFDHSYLKKLLLNIGEVAGEDKEIDFRIVKDKVTIHYLPDAYVFDEKVANSKSFTGQRSRWISAQIDCCKKYFLQGFIQLVRNRNIEFFNKVVQTILLPRVLLMGTLCFLLLTSFFNPFGLPSEFWAFLLFVAGAALLIALPARFYSRGLVKAFIHLPLALFYMVLALLKAPQAGKSFIHTPHTSTPGTMIASQKIKKTA